MTPRWGLELQGGTRGFYKDAASTRLQSLQGAQACISGNNPQISRTPPLSLCLSLLALLLPWFNGFLRQAKGHPNSSEKVWRGVLPFARGSHCVFQPA